MDQTKIIFTGGAGLDISDIPFTSGSNQASPDPLYDVGTESDPLAASNKAAKEKNEAFQQGYEQGRRNVVDAFLNMTNVVMRREFNKELDEMDRHMTKLMDRLNHLEGKVEDLENK